ncbi:MAG: DUF3488 domain-containing transglutaminase family protein [Deltaproteobacteria bacterium]|nr:DUF3488 domain-containing transglutaminase family protein [Candidatus Anaeroferrophillacea bacterium]
MLNQRNRKTSSRHAAVLLSPTAHGWLTAMAAVLVLPHLGRLPLWEIALLAVILGWKFISLGTGRKPMPGRLRLPLALAGTVGLWLTHGMVLGRNSGVATILLLAALKLQEAHTRRDGLVLVNLGWFLIATPFLFTQGIPWAFYLVTAATTVTAALIAVTLPPPIHLPTRTVLRQAGTSVVLGLPLMLVLFVLFPRIPGPLWRMPADAGRSLTGLDGEMSPGSISRLGRSAATAFRADFPEGIPPAPELYWRGPVLESFDGRTWKAVENPAPGGPSAVDVEVLAKSIPYAVALQPHGRLWLFALDLPLTGPDDARRSATGQMLARRPVETVRRDRFTSAIRYRFTPEMPPDENRRFTALPAGRNPGAVKLGRRWLQSGLPPEERIRRGLTYFSTNPFVYTLEPGLMNPTNPVDDFLFNIRRGFCEHYAGAFTLLMRAAGIPARVVTGYQGGERNPMGGHLIVRQLDAHAWTEVWLAGQGWRRIDPTAAVSPTRIAAGIADALPPDTGLPYFIDPANRLAHRLTLVWDTVNSRWNHWVLGYGPELQREFLSRFGIRDWQTTAAAITVGFLVAGLLVAMLLILPGRVGRRHDPIITAYARFCRRLGRHGLAPHPGEPPLAHAHRIGTVRPDISAAAMNIAVLYNRLRYGTNRPPELVKRLHQLVRETTVARRQARNR